MLQSRHQFSSAANPSTSIPGSVHAMAKRKTPVDEGDSNIVDEIPLESAMTELSQIVTRLESGQETLDESLAQFERGMALLRICHRKLDAAAQRIELVTQLAPDGDVLTEPFDATATMSRPSTDSTRTTRKPLAVDDSDDGTLF